MKRALELLLAGVMTAALLAGCGGSGNAPEAAPAAEAAAESGAADTGEKTLNIAIDMDFTTLMPVSEGRIGPDLVGRNLLYDSLTRFNFDTDEIECRLAESFDVADDDSSVVYHLRKGVKFHDGSEMTADDVVFSFEKLVEYQPSEWSTVESCEKIDDYTVQLNLTEPWPLLFQQSNYFYVMSKAYFEKVGADEYSVNPIGTGPYRFVSWETGSAVKYTAFEDYFRGEAPIKDVTLYVMGDPAARANALEAKDLHIAHISASATEVLEGLDYIDIVDAEAVRFCYLGISYKSEFGDNLALRQAIAYALDRDFIVSAAVGSRGAKANDIVFNSQCFGYTEDVPRYSHDEAKAKELLAEAGYPDGVDMGEILCNAGGSPIAEVIQSQLANVGITTTVQVYEDAAYFEKQQAGDFTLCVTRGGSPSADCGSQAYALVPGGSLNCAQYDNPEVTELFAKAAGTMDQTARADYYKQIAEIVQTELPVIAIYEFYDVMGVNTELNADAGFGIGCDYEVYNFSWK